MKTIHTNAKHTEWLSAEDMHYASKQWLSELEFCKEEQMFFEDLIRSYTLQILDNNHFQESKIVVEDLSKNVKETETLLKAIKIHEEKLSIMVDGINQIEEEKAYKKEHRNLTELTFEFKKRYQNLKTKLFDIIKTVIKESKQKRYIDKA